MVSNECARRWRRGTSGEPLHSPLLKKTPLAPGRSDQVKPRPHQRVNQHDADSFTTPLPHRLRVVTGQYEGHDRKRTGCQETLLSCSFLNKKLRH